MDKKIIALIATVIFASGCADLVQTDSSPEGVEPDPGAGLEVTELSVADETLRVGDGQRGQRTEVTLQLTNHHSVEVDPEIELDNLGQLKAEGKEQPCNQESLAAVQEEIVDQMECTWAIEAPSRSTMGSFDEKPLSFSVIVTYDSQIQNQEALQVRFKNRDQITDSNPVERKFSNNEVQMTIRTDNPSPLDSTRNRLEIALSNNGPGRVVNNQEYDISYQPNIVGEDCPTDDVSGRIGSEFTDTCSFDVSSPATRNLFVSAGYKYQKQQNLGVTLVR